MERLKKIRDSLKKDQAEHQIEKVDTMDKTQDASVASKATPDEAKNAHFEMDLSTFKERFEDYATRSLEGIESSNVRINLPDFQWNGNNLRIKMKISGCNDGDFLDVAGVFLEYFPGGYSYDYPAIIYASMTTDSRDMYILSKDKTEKKLMLNLDFLFTNSLNLNFEIKEKATVKDLEFLKEVWTKVHSYKRMKPEEELRTLGVELLGTSDKLAWGALGGYSDVKEEVRKTVILPVKHAEVYNRVTEQTRVRQKDITPKAVLFYGPPGTGKTTMGKIIAGDLDMPFINVPVESIFTKWYGESPRRLAEIFRLASTYERCVLFIDEIDALAIDREKMHEESRKVLSTLLTRLDGLKTKPGILTIGATNRYDDMDPAVKRRFDDEIFFRLPDETDRNSILSLYAKQLSIEEIADLAKNTGDYSGSDIERMAKDVERGFAKRLIENDPTIEGYTSPKIENYLNYIKGRKK